MRHGDQATAPARKHDRSAKPALAPRQPRAGYAVIVAGDLVIRAARPTDARAIAEVSVASRQWSYRDVLAEAGLGRPFR